MVVWQIPSLCFIWLKLLFGKWKKAHQWNGKFLGLGIWWFWPLWWHWLMFWMTLSRTPCQATLAIVPQEKKNQRTKTWGWSRKLPNLRENPEATAYLTIGGSKLWDLSDVCTSLSVLCLKLFSRENNKIIIYVTRQIKWSSFGGWCLQVSCC